MYVVDPREGVEGVSTPGAQRQSSLVAGWVGRCQVWERKPKKAAWHLWGWSEP